MIRLLLRLALGLLVALVAVAAVVFATWRFEHAPVPTPEQVAGGERAPAAAYDILGRSVSAAEAVALRASVGGRETLSPARGAVRLDDALRARGRDVFYRETFGNERFLSDVVGLLDGALSPLRLASALFELGERGTTNLEVRLARDVAIGGRVFREGEVVRTGLHVLPGERVPLGIRVSVERGRVRAGITCALCHARLDAATGKVVEGAPNRDLDLGFLLALAANPGALFPQAGIASLDPYLTRPDNIVRTSADRTAVLPDPEALARDVRTTLSAWPPGSFDSTPDGVSDPTAIPALFPAEAHPYGWSGHAAIGPLAGLYALAANMHAFAADPLADAAAAPTLYGLDPEVYLGTLLQGVSDPGYRFDPSEGRKPSEILAAARSDPGPAPAALGRVAALPSFPRPSYLSADGVVPYGLDGTIDGALLAVSAFVAGLMPPPVPIKAPADVLVRGQAVFARAGCLACHSGPALTSHRVWPASVIGTQPARAHAYARTEAAAARPQVYVPGSPAPAGSGPAPAILDVPIPDEGQIKLAWGYNRTGGGYKVPGLVGLPWRAPYLHDGGIGLGPGPEFRSAVGDGTRAGPAVPSDPAGSLRALVDREWRARLVAANRDSPSLRLSHVTGEGHAFWADREAGFDEADTQALVAYLLSIDRLQREPPPG